jgi:hypothetical protein
MTYCELESHNATSQTVTVWLDDDTSIYVDVEIKHDGEEVTRVTCEVPTEHIKHYDAIRKAVIDEVERSFEIEEDEDDPDRLYEIRNDK